MSTAPTTTSGTSRAARPEGRVSGPIVIVVLLVVTAVVALFSATIGQISIPPMEVLGSIAHHWGLDIGSLPIHPQGEHTLWVVRFPRIVLGLVVGAALGAAGCLMQGVLANPLAEPGVVGVSSGAAVGACAMIVIGGVGVNDWAMAGAAFLAALLTTAGVYVLSLRDGASSPIMLVLTGIAVNAFALGIISYLTFVATTAAREQIVFWQLGSLAGASWTAVWVSLPLAVAGIAAAMAVVHKLDLLALGEIQAASLGVKVEVVRRQAIVLVAILTAAAVAFTGIIAFVGLVVPHVMRLIVGPRHAVLLPASVIGGALVLAAADLASRTVLGGADLPLGVFTSLVGGPVFFILLRRNRNAGAGF
ncbi:iron ABC transporter permease [Gordonia sp. NB41Y]|uniref:FecCD family ABC transporter permease n=1 Tax=Gordonia sp. NB41Y TaxID=875808 RepID=UPI0006B1D2A3|nr:iron ABC transporter permease [Gordonia sp. NB41Y]KOY49870.1 hemin ABC transporter permease [Gordonia sp. NB41Y]WLP91178.1 iron ABC transporter permease [Gordonia sp. NB41Y]